MSAKASPQRESLAPPAGAAGLPTAVVAAMREELAPLIHRVRVARRLRLGRSGRAFCGRLGRTPLVVGWTGDGRDNAAEGLRALLDAVPVGRLLVLGVAGGLTRGLAPGSVVVAERLLDGDDPVGLPDAAWLDTALRRSGAVAGCVVSADRILASPEEKRAAAAKLPAGSPAVVDLESSTYARIAGSRGLDWLVARAVSDTAEEKLPLDFNRYRDARGAVRRGRVALYALRHPSVIPRLLGLGRRVADCAGRLADLTESTLDVPTPSGDLQ